MKKQTLIFIFLLLCLAVLAGLARFVWIPEWNQRQKVALNLDVTPTPVAVPGANEVADANFTDDLAALTARQRLAQLLAVSFNVPSAGTSFVATGSSKLASPTAQLAWIQAEQPGMVVLFGKQIATPSAIQVIRQIKTDQGQLSPLVAVDHEGGTVQRLSGKGFSVLPSAAQLCQLSSTELASALSRSASELKGVGIDVVFAPVVDVASQSAVLKDRVCSDQPAVVEKFARTWLSAFQTYGIASVLKHYPGIGQTKVDLHKQNETIAPLVQTRQLFQNILSEVPVVGVMSAHVATQVTGVASPSATQLAGLPCSLDPECIHQLQLQSNQMIISDSLEMASLYAKAPTSADMALSVIKAIQAGNTMVLLGPTVGPSEFEVILTQLQYRYQVDREFTKLVDEAVIRLWRFKQARLAMP